MVLLEIASSSSVPLEDSDFESVVLGFCPALSFWRLVPTLQKKMDAFDILTTSLTSVNKHSCGSRRGGGVSFERTLATSQ